MTDMTSKTTGRGSVLGAVQWGALAGLMLVLGLALLWGAAAGWRPGSSAWMSLCGAGCLMAGASAWRAARTAWHSRRGLDAG